MNTWTLPQNAASFVMENPLLARLALVSVELAFLASAVALVIVVARIKAPRVRAILWLLVLAKPVLGLVIGAPLPVLSFEAPQALVVEETLAGAWEGAATDADWVSPVPPVSSSVMLPSLPPAPDVGSDVEPEPVPPTEPGIRLNMSTASLLVGAWVAGVLAFAFLTLRDQVRIHRLCRSATKPPERLRDRYEEVFTQMAIQRVPRLLVTDRLSSPALIGFVRPVVLLPRWLATEADTRQLDWLLRHELMHWKLRDPVGVVVRQLAKMLFFFHPAVWWAGRKWEEAMELACDRALFQTEADARDYAEQLYRVLENRAGNAHLQYGNGLFATRTQIGKRMAALLTDPLRSPAHLSGLSMAGMVLAAVLALPAGCGVRQADSREVKSPATELAPPPVSSRDVSSFTNADNARSTDPVFRSNPIAWGEPVNGLRATFEFVPAKETYASGEAIAIRLRVENVSSETIVFPIPTPWEIEAIILSPTGSEFSVIRPEFEPTAVKRARQLLRPGEESEFNAGGLRFLDVSTSGSAKPNQTTVFCHPGQFRVGFKVRLEEKRVPTSAWHGILQTDERELVVRRRQASGVSEVSDEEDLAWGPEENGLRMALELLPVETARAFQEPLRIRLHVRNASSQTIKLRGLAHEDIEIVATDEKGTTLPVYHPPRDSRVSVVFALHKLDGGEVKTLAERELVFVNTSDGRFESSGRKIVVGCRPGPCFVRCKVRLTHVPHPPSPPVSALKSTGETGTKKILIHSGNPARAGEAREHDLIW